MHQKFKILLCRIADQLGYEITGDGGLVCLLWDKRKFEAREVFGQTLVTENRDQALEILGFMEEDHRATILSGRDPEDAKIFEIIASCIYFSPKMFDGVLGTDPIFAGFMTWWDCYACRNKKEEIAIKEVAIASLDRALDTIADFNANYQWIVLARSLSKTRSGLQ